MIHLVALFLYRIVEYAVTGTLPGGGGGGMNFDVPVPNPERKFVFRGIGVAGRFAGGPIFYIQAVTHFYSHRGVSFLALKMGGAEPNPRRLRSS